MNERWVLPGNRRDVICLKLKPVPVAVSKICCTEHTLSVCSCRDCYLINRLLSALFPECVCQQYPLFSFIFLISFCLLIQNRGCDRPGSDRKHVWGKFGAFTEHLQHIRTTFSSSLWDFSVSSAISSNLHSFDDEMTVYTRALSTCSSGLIVPREGVWEPSAGHVKYIYFQ